jgi:cathepsin E
MVLALTLLPAVLLALRVAAGPVLVEDSFISLPISRRFNFTGTGSVVQNDIARLQAIKTRKAAKQGLAARAVISEPVDNQVVTYIVRNFS